MTLQRRRQKLNKFCDLKCSDSQPILNFTDRKIPEKLEIHLKYGLKNTPCIEVEVATLKHELEDEAIQFCNQLYHQYYGIYPKIQAIDTFDNKMLSIISQCTTNSRILKQIIDFRTAFVESLPFFLSVQNNDGMILCFCIRKSTFYCIIPKIPKKGKF